MVAQEFVRSSYEFLEKEVQCPAEYINNQWYYIYWDKRDRSFWTSKDELINNPNEHGLGTLAEPYHPPTEEAKGTTASEDEEDTPEPDSDVSQRTPILQRRAISTREYGLFIETELHQEVEQTHQSIEINRH